MPKEIQLPSGKRIRVPDDITDAEMDEIAAAEAGKDTAPAARSDEPPPKDWVDSLPSAMGLGFSLAGGSRATPIGMGLGALGGAAGEGFRQTIRSIQGRDDQVPGSVLERIQAMGAEGATQGAMEGVGRGVGKVLTPIAKGLYGAAVRPAFDIARNVGGGRLLPGMTRIINEGFENRVMPTAGGYAKAVELTKASKGAADDLARGGPDVPLDEVLKEAATDQATRMQELHQGAGIRPDYRQAAGQLDELLAANRPPSAVGNPRTPQIPGRQGPPPPVTISTEQLTKIRRASEDVAEPVFTAARRGTRPPVMPGSQESVARSVAGAAKERLERELGPAYRAANQTTQARFGLGRAIDAAAARPNMLTNLLAGGAGVASANNPTEALAKGAAYRAAFDPRAMAAAGFALPAVGQFAPRALDVVAGGDLSEELRRALMEQLMKAGEPPPEE